MVPIVRRWRRSDVPAIARLYYQTVRLVNARDYRPEQIRAWAPRVYPDGYWLRRFRGYRVYVAQVEDQLAGFAELAEDGEVDCFYVHHAVQGRGVGRALVRQLVAVARARGITRLFADVSRTAKPFFRRQGFRVQRRLARHYRGRTFAQWQMWRQL